MPVCIKVATIDWSQHPHMSFQHNKNMTTSHFDIFLHILIIYKLHGHVSMRRYPCWLDGWFLTVQGDRFNALIN